jgi:hypothetical protein
VTTVFTADPGACSGVAVSYNGRIIKCGLFAQPIYLCTPDVTIVEVPEVYRRGKARPEDLINVALVAGGWLHFNRGAVEKTPNPKQWKGQVSKACTARRVLKALAPGELEVLWADLARDLPKVSRNDLVTLIEADDEKGWDRCKANNLVDAVAINLWHLGRYR